VEADSPGGTIQIQAKTVAITSGGLISVFSEGSGDAGIVALTTSTILIDGTGPYSFTGISAETDATPGGRGGYVAINADSVTLVHGAQISTSSLGGGDGGDIQIRAGNLTLETSASIASAAYGSGKAGGITLNVDGSVLIEHDANLSVSAAQAEGGDITVTAGSDIRLVNGQINAQAAADGGNVHLTTPAAVYLLDSRITAQSVNGGNATIDPTVVVLDNSQINTSAGINGGNITIVSDFVLSSPGLDQSLFFTGRSGINGTVTVTSPDASLAGNFLGLPANPLAADSRLRPHCSVRLPRGVSSFTTVGRGGTPIEPDGLLPASPLAPEN
jgi:large exoprotein involved in heme utilization and adhesion